MDGAKEPTIREERPRRWPEELNGVIESRDYSAQRGDIGWMKESF